MVTCWCLQQFLLIISQYSTVEQFFLTVQTFCNPFRLNIECFLYFYPLKFIKTAVLFSKKRKIILSWVWGGPRGRGSMLAEARLRVRSGSVFLAKIDYLEKSSCERSDYLKESCRRAMDFLAESARFPAKIWLGIDYLVDSLQVLHENTLFVKEICRKSCNFSKEIHLLLTTEVIKETLFELYTSVQLKEKPSSAWTSKDLKVS